MAIHFCADHAKPSDESGSRTPIRELSLELPEGVGELALIILNGCLLSAEYAGENAYPSVWLGLSVNGDRLIQNAGFFSQQPTPPTPVYGPTTVVAAVPLAEKRQKIEAMWFSGNFGIAKIGVSSLSAIIA